MVASGLAVACFGWCLTHPPLSARRFPSAMMTEDMPKDAGSHISKRDLEVLRARIAKIQECGGAIPTPSQKLFEIVTEKTPTVMLRDFFASCSPLVQQGMQDAVMSLLGALPPFEFDSQARFHSRLTLTCPSSQLADDGLSDLACFATRSNPSDLHTYVCNYQETATGDKMAALMLQLQMTGYMLRNAEYVLTLRKLLGISSSSAGRRILSTSCSMREGSPD